jgi:hypothetical protein
MVSLKEIKDGIARRRLDAQRGRISVWGRDPNLIAMDLVLTVDRLHHVLTLVYVDLENVLTEDPESRKTKSRIMSEIEKGLKETGVENILCPICSEVAAVLFCPEHCPDHDYEYIRGYGTIQCRFCGQDKPEE